MQGRMSQRVEYAEEDQACRANDREPDAQPTQHLLRQRGVAHQPAPVPQPALREEGRVEEDGRHAGPGDEERFQRLCPDVGDVCYVLRGIHRGVVRSPTDVPVDQEAEEHTEPAEAGDHREDLW